MRGEGVRLIPPGLLFGLLSAVSWGTSDFAGGLATRRSSVLATLLAGQGIGVAAAVAVLLISGEKQAPAAALAWAAVAGLSGVTGLGSFYRALATGTMGTAAPTVAVIGAGVPALVGVARGDALTAAQLLGVAAALASVAIVSRPSEQAVPEAPGAPVARSVAFIVVAGLGFAGFFLLMDQAADAGAGTWWSVVVARTAAVAVVGAALAWTRLRPASAADHSSRPPGARPPFSLVVLAGLGDVGGNAFFLLANAEGPLSIAAVVSSLYPVTTVLLASLFLRERLGRMQLVGVGLALAGIVLIAA